MPYDERTISELSESAEITPMGIQLEVNAEIFTTIHNLLWTVKDEVEIDRADESRLYSLWRTTIREMSLIELRKGHGLPMSTQVGMLQEAYNIETRYMADQIFRPVNMKLARQMAERESGFHEDEMNDLFERTVWPSVKENKTGNQKHPMAFIIAGQPGSGKTRMSSMIIEEYGGNIIQSMSDNFRGFHPRFRQLLKKYGQYCACFSIEQGKYLSDLTMKKAAEGRYHILQEGSLENVAHTLDYISYLKDMGYEPGLQPEAKHYAIKMPVFSFEKIRGADISLGPEMKSTGECLGIAETFNEALYKAFIGAGIRLPKHKNMIITVKDEDKQDIIPIARRFEALGYRIYATLGTAKVLKENGIKVIRTNKLEQPAPNLMDLILGHKIDVVIDTPPQGVEHQKDGFVIRRNAIETGVNVLTSLDTAEALVTSLENTDLNNLSLIDIATIARR